MVDEEGFVLFVRKNALIVLIPRFGLEGSVFFDTKDTSAPQLVFDEEVRGAGSPAPGAASLEGLLHVRSGPHPEGGAAHLPHL